MTILQLRSDVRFTAQPTLNQWRCTLEDPRTQRFYRLGRTEYLIASALDGTRDLGQVVDVVALQLRREASDSTARDPEMAAEGDRLSFSKQVESTVRWLLTSGLVIPAALAGETVTRGNPSSLPNERDQTSRLAVVHASDRESLLFRPSGDPFGFRVSMLSGKTIESWGGGLTWLFSWPMGWIALALLVITSIVVGADPQRWMEASAKLFVPEAAWWWLSAWLLLKTAHELGHALACMAFGGKIRTAGLAFFYLAPIPFVDTTDMWRLPNRLARMVCAMAGIMAEMVVACVALLIGYSVESTSLQYFCYSLATLGTITTLVFNGNPLARFDGYFLVSDLLDRPNLWTEGQTAIMRWLHLFYKKNPPIPALVSLPISAYGFACLIYRALVLVGLGWGAWITWQGIGLVLMAVAVSLWFIVPARKAYLQRKKAGGLAPAETAFSSLSYGRLAFSGLALAGVGGIGMFVTSPWQTMSPAYVAFRNVAQIRCQSDGILTEMLALDGEQVEEGQPLFRLTNSQLQLAYENAQMELSISRERSRILRAEGKISEYQIETAKAMAVETTCEQLKEQVRGLTIAACQSGTFQTAMRSQTGTFCKAGSLIGTIADSQHREVVGSVEQADAQQFRDSANAPVYVRLGNGRTVTGMLSATLPRGSDVLENTALAAKYGGPIAVRVESANANETKYITETPRFEVRVQLGPLEEKSLPVGQLCYIRLANRPETLCQLTLRWLDSLRRYLTPSASR